MTLTLDPVSTLSSETVQKIKSRLTGILDEIEQYINEDHQIDLITEMHIDEAYEHLDSLSIQKANDTWIRKAEESINVLQVIREDLKTKSMRLEEIEMI